MRLALTPSGLTMDRVRSSAIREGPLKSFTQPVRVFAPACAAGARAGPEVYLGSRTRGNLACDGSAGLVRLFAPPGRRAAPAQARGVRGARGCFRPRSSPRDRKSTRLNSSHRCISYAGFCLKKKRGRLGGPVKGGVTGTPSPAGALAGQCCEVLAGGAAAVRLLLNCSGPLQQQGLCAFLRRI